MRNAKLVELYTKAMSGSYSRPDVTVSLSPAACLEPCPNFEQSLIKMRDNRDRFLPKKGDQLSFASQAHFTSDPSLALHHNSSRRQNLLVRTTDCLKLTAWFFRLKNQGSNAMIAFVGSGFPALGRSRALRELRSPLRRVYKSSSSTLRASAEASREEVRRIAILAQLELSEDEITEITPEFQKVIGFFNSINELDVDGIEPMSTPNDVHNVLRDDTPVMFTNVYV